MSEPAKPGVPLEVRIKELVAAPNLRAVQSDAALEDLAASIKAFGVLEPVLVELHPEIHNGAGKTEGQIWLVAGQRRVAAAKLAGLTTVPAIVVPTTNDDRTQVQLVENLQREDLKPIDEARALKAVLDTGITQVDLAKRIGRSQPYIANRVRLLGLPEKGVELLDKGQLTPKAAEKILALGEERAQKTVVEYAVDRAKGSHVVNEQDLEYSLRDAQRRVHERREAAKKVAAAKVPNCPVKSCGKKGRPPSLYCYGDEAFRCGSGHRWSPKTGKLASKERSYGSTYRAPAPPKLPEVNVEIPTTLTQAQLARRILDSVKEIRGVRLEWLIGGTRAELQITVEIPSIKASKVPQFGYAEGRKFLELEEYRYQHDDAMRKRAAVARADLEVWLATFGKQKVAA